MTSTARRSASAADADGQWLAAQHDVAGRAAHELKNTMNAVAVNLEVVRTRLARPGVQPEQVTRFAESAAAQFELLTAQVEALIGLTRASATPADVGATLGQLLALRHGGAARAAGAVARGPATAAAPSLVRLLLARALDGEGAVEATLHEADGRAVVRVAPAAEPNAELRALAAAGAVELQYVGAAAGDPALTLIFPDRGR